MRALKCAPRLGEGAVESINGFAAARHGRVEAEQGQRGEYREAVHLGRTSCKVEGRWGSGRGPKCWRWW